MPMGDGCGRVHFPGARARRKDLERSIINRTKPRAGRLPAIAKEVTLTDTIHPAPEGFTENQLQADPILRYFHFAHLPDSLKVTSIKFFELACYIVAVLPRNAERSVALRKLLEAKDAAVRANVQ